MSFGSILHLSHERIRRLINNSLYGICWCRELNNLLSSRFIRHLIPSRTPDTMSYLSPLFFHIFPMWSAMGSARDFNPRSFLPAVPFLLVHRCAVSCGYPPSDLTSESSKPSSSANFCELDHRPFFISSRPCSYAWTKTLTSFSGYGDFGSTVVIQSWKNDASFMLHAPYLRPFFQLPRTSAIPQ